MANKRKVKESASTDVTQAATHSGLSQTQKIGWTLLAASLGMLGLKLSTKYVEEAETAEQSRLYSSLGVFWVFLLFGVVKSFLWSPPAEPQDNGTAAAAPDNANDANGETVTPPAQNTSVTNRVRSRRA